MKDSLFKPRKAAAEVLGWSVPRRALVELGAFLSIVISILAYFAFTTLPDEQKTLFATLFEHPIIFALSQFGYWWIISIAINSAGRMPTMKGNWDGAALLASWHLLIASLIVVTGAMIGAILAPLAIVIFLFYLIWYFWALCAFAVELNNIENPWRAFAGLIVTLVGLSFALNLVFVMIVGSPAEVPN